MLSFKQIVFLVLVFFYTMSSPLKSAQPKIHYQLSMPKPYSHLLEVDITLSNLDDDQYLDLLLPAWRPGRYIIFDFAEGIQEFIVSKGENSKNHTKKNKKLTWTKTHKATWRIETKGAKTLTVSYKVFSNDFALRTRGLNDRHAFVNGAAVFMYAEKYRHSPVTLEIHPYGDWHTTTGLDRVDNKKNLFQAPDYDYFIDCPLEVGQQQDFEFEFNNKKHYLSVAGGGNWQAPQLIERLKKVVATNYEFWGDLPYEHYTFLVHSTPNGRGATEHINSTIMGMKQFSFRTQAGYDEFTRLATHEFFHTWNVKQLRPAGIHPYDYSRENYSKLLWVAEGTTSYYTIMLMRRAGFYSTTKVFDQIVKMITEDRTRPGHRLQSLEQSSYDAWIKYWKKSEHDQNSEVSYYSKGAAVSLLLDLEIRHRSKNRGSLDSVMQQLYKQYPLRGNGFTPENFLDAVEGIGDGDYEDFFSKYVSGTAAIDFAGFLKYAGLKVAEKNISKDKIELGISTTELNDKIFVKFIRSGSSAYDAGLNAGDELIALNGHKIQSTLKLENHLKDFSPEEKIQFTLFREDELRNFEVTLRAPEAPEFTIDYLEDATELQIEIYEDWLNATWPHSNE